MEGPYSKMSRDELLRERANLKIVYASLLSKQKKMQQDLTSVAEAIATVSSEESDVIITDHAIIRWLERVEGVDLEPIRQTMRMMVAGRVSPHTENDIVVGEKGVIVTRRGLAVVTALSLDQLRPEQGQFKVLKND
jgi:hypothetical protein